MNLFISVEFSTSYVSWCSKVWPKKFDTRNKKKKGKNFCYIATAFIRLLSGNVQRIPCWGDFFLIGIVNGNLLFVQHDMAKWSAILLRHALLKCH